MHIVMTSRFESIFEVIRRGMSREEARKYIRILSRYHRIGFFAFAQMNGGQNEKYCAQVKKVLPKAHEISAFAKFCLPFADI